MTSPTPDNMSGNATPYDLCSLTKTSLQHHNDMIAATQYDSHSEASPASRKRRYSSVTLSDDFGSSSVVGDGFTSPSSHPSKRRRHDSTVSDAYSHPSDAGLTDDLTAHLTANLRDSPPTSPHASEPRGMESNEYPGNECLDDNNNDYHDDNNEYLSDDDYPDNNTDDPIYDAQASEPPCLETNDYAYAYGASSCEHEQALHAANLHIDDPACRNADLEDANEAQRQSFARLADELHQCRKADNELHDRNVHLERDMEALRRENEGLKASAVEMRQVVVEQGRELGEAYGKLAKCHNEVVEVRTELLARVEKNGQ